MPINKTTAPATPPAMPPIGDFDEEIALGVFVVELAVTVLVLTVLGTKCVTSSTLQRQAPAGWPSP